MHKILMLNPLRRKTDFGFRTRWSAECPGLWQNTIFLGGRLGVLTVWSRQVPAGRVSGAADMQCNMNAL